MDLWCQQTERCLGRFIRTFLILRFPHGLFTRECTRLLAGGLSASTGSCLTGELFRLEGRASVAGEVAELIAKVPGFCLEGAKRVFGVLPEFCVRVPGSHVKEEVENRFVVWGEEEAVEHGNATLDRKIQRSKRATVHG